ncbi:MAG: hypothetical protein EZS26_000599 [Candidatus Ordinivivax streblomastigis]|uniref:Uncharacterized protein n=1 Tax=Candidatus Ordinivivax streblomastigis TaxID=2540710 RepID=A0A5M8P497_9BACT|nr:MAG: hypothetical protein EZS26_000368 [Candidatus Ordinivivax streblomastigis]KAA6303439.1 MAG: hypothetical protein EZS26_000599 [Candidatus Ordinivivax streblomastigis]
MGLNYTYQKAQDFTYPEENGDGGSYGGQIAYIPWHSGSAIANIIWKTWGLNYSFIYVGERYHVSSNILANYERPWYTHDLTFGKTLKWRTNKGACPLVMKLSAEINNILNQQFDVVYNYPMPGRNFKLILKMEL